MTDDIAVCGQPRPEDMAVLAAAGFKTVICNRPDGEEPGQPTMDENRIAAEAAGLAYACVPVKGPISDDQQEEFDRLVATLPKPLVAHCKGGGRSATLVRGFLSNG